MAFLPEKEDRELSDADMAEFSDGEQKQKRRGKKKNPGVRKIDEEVADSGDSDDVGVVYLSHIPHGFYEPQMRHFFGQFGTVTRLKLFRSKKSGKSRGFAYIEFEYADVAKIVADTMNNYLMFQKLLKCIFIPKGELCASAFTNADRPFAKPYHREASVKRHNSLLKADQTHILKSQKRLVRKEAKRRKKMEQLGIAFNPSGYEEDWQKIKKARAIIDAKERKQKMIEQRKLESLKREKEKARRHSKKRKQAKKQKLQEEKEKAKAEQSRESTDEKPEDGDGDKKSPKRKSSDGQDPAMSSTTEADGQPRKKGRFSAPVTPDQKVSSTESSSKKDEEEKLPTVGQNRRSKRLSLRSRAKSAGSPASKSSLKTPKKTLSSTVTRRTTRVTPKSEDKSLAQKKDSSTPKMPAQRRKELHKDTKMPRSESKLKLPETGSSGNDFESDDISEEEVKIKEFKGIKLKTSQKKEASSSGKIQAEIRFAGDQLLVF